MKKLLFFICLGALVALHAMDGNVFEQEQAVRRSAAIALDAANAMVPAMPWDTLEKRAFVVRACESLRAYVRDHIMLSSTVNPVLNEAVNTASRVVMQNFANILNAVAGEIDGPEALVQARVVGNLRDYVLNRLRMFDDAWSRFEKKLSIISSGKRLNFDL